VFVIRQARIEDVPTLLKLAKMVHFINLPADREVIYSKVSRSRECFLKAAGHQLEEHQPARANGAESGLRAVMRKTDFFMFVLEDTETGACLGTSQVIARMGGPGNPNYSFKLSRREYFSKSLQTGTSHVVARLHGDESGPTEIGGLILQPASRGHHLGRLLSFVRFHFIGMHRPLFADRMLAEMMAPISLDGQNLLWEYLGRRFIPLSYTEADKHCQRSREFIEALLPKTDIYLSLLPPEARDVVGRVHEETVPARKMLEKLGFKFKDLVDPFDGGPHLEAVTDQVPLVKSTRTAELGAGLAATGATGATGRALISYLNGDGEYRAVDAPCTEERGKVSISKQIMSELGWERGITVGLTPLEKIEPKRTERKAPARRRKVRS
jgi:arginine N-succinyltransferase